MRGRTMSGLVLTLAVLALASAPAFAGEEPQVTAEQVQTAITEANEALTELQPAVEAVADEKQQRRLQRWLKEAASDLRRAETRRDRGQEPASVMEWVEEAQVNIDRVDATLNPDNR